MGTPKNKPDGEQTPPPANAPAAPPASGDPTQQGGEQTQPSSSTQAEPEKPCEKCAALKGAYPCSVECYVKAGYEASTFDAFMERRRQELAKAETEKSGAKTKEPEVPLHIQIARREIDQADEAEAKQLRELVQRRHEEATSRRQQLQAQGLDMLLTARKGAKVYQVDEGQPQNVIVRAQCFRPGALFTAVPAEVKGLANVSEFEFDEE